MTVADALDAYLAEMTRHCAGFTGFFASPARPLDLAALGQTLGRPVPEPLHRLLARHDGSGDAWVVPGYCMLTARSIAREWQVWEDLRVTEFDPDGITCTPEGPILGDRWWRPGWVPFAGDGTGDFLCLDTDPAPGGDVGQIITLQHDDGRRAVVAPSLDRWFLDLAAAARDGRVIWDAEHLMAVWADTASQ